MSNNTGRVAGKVALVTGAGSGLGRCFSQMLAAEGAKVVMTDIDGDSVRAAAAEVGEAALALTHDVTDEARWQEVVGEAVSHFGGLHVLVNNAGIFIDGDLDNPTSICDTDVEVIRKTLEVNTIAPIMLIRALLPLMREADYGRIVNVSSGMGQLCDMNGNWPGYRISKTGLNAVTRILSEELVEKAIKVNCVCPGWVRTDMGSERAPRSPEQGVETIVWLATLPEDGATGGFFRDRQQINW